MGLESTEDMKTEQSREMKKKAEKEYIFHASPTKSRAVEPNSGPEVKVLKSSKKIYRFIWDLSLNELDDEYELDAVFVLSEDVNLVLADSP